MKRPVVFLDRDGTLNEEVGYITDLSRLVLIHGAAQAIRLLNQHNVAAVLVTNQSGAARGFYPESHIQALNERLTELLKLEGAYLDGLYYCPHLPQGIVPYLAQDCLCRKPKPGMVQQAFRDNSCLDSARAYVIGDKSTDVELARNCQAKAVLVTTGFGQQVIDGSYQWKVNPDFIASNIGTAISWVINDLK
ncbi:MAG: HAD family hydrolase [Candidatus Melainabacteria bacterium]|nr:HAD family hydrolase [Candidatus Melainabacteria bacterium]